jgi:tripeptidyl-peptidase I
MRTSKEIDFLSSHDVDCTIIKFLIMKEILRLQAAIILLTSHLFAPCICRRKSRKHFDAIQNFGSPDNLGHQLNRSARHILREKEAGLSYHYDITLMERASSAELHEVIFVIHQKNMGELKRILNQVSDPTHLNYGNHMTSQDVADLTKNHNSQESVIEYLEVIGATVISQTMNGECITARASISIWEEMLDTKFYKYSHQPKSDENSKPMEFIRAQEYSVPDRLDDHIASVLNTIQLPEIRTNRLSTSNTLINVPTSFLNYRISEDGFVTPARINEAYRIETNVGHPRATQAVYETSGQYYSAEDLLSFQNHFELPIQAVNESVGSVTHTAAACKNNGNCVEGNLDVQYITATAQTPTLFYYTDLVMTLFLVNLVNTGNPPLVISFSYGISEFYISKGEYELFNSQAIKLGAMGVTLLFATGDDGAANAAARNNPSRCAYAPFFPASSPYVTSVGATQVYYDDGL